jgi:hypothetical protein
MDHLDENTTLYDNGRKDIIKIKDEDKIVEMSIAAGNSSLS